MNYNAVNNKLFLIPKAAPKASLRLFLFPYAGGSASTYIPWVSDLSDSVEVVIIQPPGRGSRLGELPFDNMSSLVADIMLAKDLICDKPCVFFGHSLGSRVAFETCVQLQRFNLPLPLHLIVSGSKAAHIASDNRNINDLPEKEFIEELRRLNGTPKEVIDNYEILSMLIPLLRADFKIAEDYISDSIRIDTPISALGGAEDIDVEYEQIKAWEELTTHHFNLTIVPGDHFFVNSERAIVIKKVNDILENIDMPEMLLHKL